MERDSRLLTALCFVCVSFASYSAQAQDTRFVLNTGGPVSPVQAFAWSPDGSRLYSAGFDKVVHSWQFTVSRRSGSVKVNLAQVLRWEISRGSRGVIYTIASSPVNRDLAIAGSGARDGVGDIVIYDTAAAQVRTALRSKDAPVREGHSQAIISLAWSPNGQYLASASIDGELRVWSAPNYATRLLRSALVLPRAVQGEKTDQAYPMVFLTDTILAAAAPSQANPKVWQIILYDLAAPPGTAPVALAQPHPYGIRAVVRQRAGASWATADKAGNTYLWNGPNPAQQPRLLKQGFAAGALEFGPPGTLFAMGIPATSGSVVQMWDLATGKVIDETYTTRLEENTHGLACSPDDKWLAAMGGDDKPIVVYQLKDPQGAPLPKPLSGELLPLFLRGRGERQGVVAFAADGSLRVGFGRLDSSATVDQFTGRIPDRYGSVRSGFDLKNGVLLPPEAAKTIPWLTPDAGAGGWQVVGKPGEPWVLHLKYNGKLYDTIELNQNRQGRVASYCWLADPKQPPWGLAIGTDHQNGIYIYKRGADNKFQLVRHFRDHTHWVTSISLSGDGRYLATASADQTIKLWSLDGIRGGDRRFARTTAWGAIFDRDAQGLFVAGVSRDGIAARRGLQPGDRIVKLVLGGQVAVADRDGMFAALSNLPLWEVAILTLARQPQLPIVIVPAWEPLATLFVDGAGEWALSAPQGHYDASTHGDEMIGWQINLGPEITPQFFLAAQLRNELERPDLLRSLFAAGDLPTAVDQLKVEIRGGNLTLLVSNLAKNLPQIVNLLPNDASLVKEAPTLVQAQIQYPTPPSAKGYRIRAFVNGGSYDPIEPIRPGEMPTQVSFSIPEPVEKNDVVVKIDNLGSDLFVDRTTSFRGLLRPEGRPRLHVLALAAAEFKIPAQRLNYPVNDADALIAMLRERAADIYTPGSVIKLANAELSKESLGQAIEQLSQALRGGSAQDLLVVFVAGHGELVGSKLYFATTNVDLSDRQAIQQHGIAWDQLAELAKFNCRKLFLLDTCNSGNVLSQLEAKQSVRPFTLNGALVMTATAANQPAHEFVGDEHGLFTKVLLEALSGRADRGRDGEIDSFEAAAFVRSEVPKAKAEQTPMTYPLDLFGLDALRLTRYQVNVVPAAGPR